MGLSTLLFRKLKNALASYVDNSYFNSVTPTSIKLDQITGNINGFQPDPLQIHDNIKKHDIEIDSKTMIFLHE